MSEPISWNIIKTVKKEEKKEEYKPDKRISKIYEAKEKFNSEMRIIQLIFNVQNIE